MPQEIKSATMLGKHIYFFDVAVIAGYWMVMSTFEDAIHPKIQLAYTLFNVLVAFIMTRPSWTNPEKRIFQSIYLWLIRDKNVYHTKMIIKEDDDVRLE